MSSDMSPDGMKNTQRRATEDEDVEGHMKNAARRVAEEPEGYQGRARIEGEDEDVEGHGVAMRSPSSRGE